MRQDKNMSIKAIDIVLLPPEPVMDKAIEMNRQPVEKYGSEIVLNKENHLPHISLAMGCIDEENLNPVGDILQSIAKNVPLGELTITGVTVTANSIGQKVSAFQLEITKPLQELHEEVMRKLTPHLSYEVTADMIYPGEDIAESTLLWIKNYRQKSSFENFSPHITLGYGQANELPRPIKFAAPKLALCHLGNHCTCRKVLLSIKL
jgi:2'-5' RNA ligase